MTESLVLEAISSSLYADVRRKCWRMNGGRRMSGEKRRAIGTDTGFFCFFNFQCHVIPQLATRWDFINIFSITIVVGL